MCSTPGPDRVLGVAGGNLLGSEVNCLLAGAAHAVERDGGHFDRKARQQHRQPADVGALLAGLADAAGDDVLDLGGRDLGPFAQASQRAGQDRVGPNVAIRATLTAKRRSHRFDDNGLGHDRTPHSKRRRLVNCTQRSSTDEVHRLLDRQRVSHIAGVESAGRFKQ